MNPSHQLADHIRQAYFGGNWTASCLKKHLDGTMLQEVTDKVDSLNSIAALAYHIDYYLQAIMRVINGKPLDAHDKFSFDHPPFATQADWNDFLRKMWEDAEQFAERISSLSEEQLASTFVENKYGTYFRNIIGFLEHTHYHLGQIVVIKKLIEGRR
jgi:hypothetical protein